jgi:hypothetical protein
VVVKNELGLRAGGWLGGAQCSTASARNATHDNLVRGALSCSSAHRFTFVGQMLETRLRMDKGCVSTVATLMHHGTLAPGQRTAGTLETCGQLREHVESRK